MAIQIGTSHLEGLITFLTVARLGKFTAAASSMGVNHSTISRRLNDLEKALGEPVLVRGVNGWELTELGTRVMPIAEKAEAALRELTDVDDSSKSRALGGVVRIAAPDAYTSYIAIPALAKLQQNEPHLGIDIMTATQQVRQRRSGVDIEVVIGEPKVNKAVSTHLLNYQLKLYATQDYLDRNGVPETIDDLAEHRLNYYVESALEVDDLDSGARKIPHYKNGISSTSVFAHLSATMAGAGIGLLPEFAFVDQALIPVLENDFSHEVTYWAVVRNENIRNPSVRACLNALTEGSRIERFNPIPSSNGN
ncbi:LysR family transcriptional regulator [Corynebacterium lubricantis]|uniref:LysR family transcriptional regulator n=1 Tax=Corynebacterium lubricantis TaxID=541095 RepID=UPI00036FBF5D|nr:LysR family transcriptional regulator [Corynebacterium lubricantis]